MGCSGGVLKGSCGAYGEEGRRLEEEPRSPFASSWILTPITSAATEKDARAGGGGGRAVDGGGGRTVTLRLVSFAIRANAIPKSSNMASNCEVHGARLTFSSTVLMTA